MILIDTCWGCAPPQNMDSESLGSYRLLLHPDLPDNKWHPWTFLTYHHGPDPNRPKDPDLCLWAVRKLKGEVPDQNRQDGLEESNKPEPKVSTEKRKQTLIPINARFLPRHIRGPAENVRRWRYPWISSFLVLMLGVVDDGFEPLRVVGSNHRLGSNVEASEPQSASDLLTPMTGIRMRVPLAMGRLSMTAPEAVVMRCERGMVSSSFACA